MAEDTKPMKVMHVIGSLRTGGAEMFFLRFVEGMKKSNLNVEILPVVRENSWISSQLEQMEISHKTAPFGGFFDIKTRHLLYKYVKEFQPDVIQSWMSRASKFVPNVAIPKVARLGGYYKLKYYRKMDYLVGNTQDICRYLKEKGWPADRIDYLPNFTVIPPEGYKVKGPELREKYNIDSNKFVVLMAGRLHENKGFDIALRALNDLPENVHFLVVGDGPQKEFLNKIVEEFNISNKVTFTGWQDDITPFVAASNLWLVPSRIEPLGNTVLDAWAHNIPVVAAAVSGPQALIAHKLSGFLVKPEDEKAIVEGITCVLKDNELQTIMVAEGKKVLEENYSQQKVLSQYMDFYNCITGRITGRITERITGKTEAGK